MAKEYDNPYLVAPEFGLLLSPDTRMTTDQIGLHHLNGKTLWEYFKFQYGDPKNGGYMTKDRYEQLPTEYKTFFTSTNDGPFGGTVYSLVPDIDTRRGELINVVRTVEDTHHIYSADFMKSNLPTAVTENIPMAWTSYQDAAAAGYANIYTQSEWARRKNSPGNEASKYTSYQDYLAAKYAEANGGALPSMASSTSNPAGNPTLSSDATGDTSSPQEPQSSSGTGYDSWTGRPSTTTPATTTAPRSGVIRNTAGEQTVYSMDTSKLLQDPTQIYSFAALAKQQYDTDVRQQQDAAQQQIREDLTAGTIPSGYEGLDITSILGGAPEYTTDADGNKKIVLSEDQLSGVIDYFMVDQTKKINQNTQLDHLTHIFADPMKDMSAGSRYNANTGNAYAQNPGSEAWVPFPTAGATDLAHMLNTINGAYPGGATAYPKTTLKK